MPYRVFIPSKVENQLLDHALYIANESIDRALAWEADTRKRILELGHFPESSTIDPDATSRVGHEVRRHILGNHIVHYSIDHAAQTVVIENVRHAARRPETE